MRPNRMRGCEDGIFLLAQDFELVYSCCAVDDW